MKKFIFLAIGLTLLTSAAVIIAEVKADAQPKDSAEAAKVDSKVGQESNQIVVYYLHMDRRCMTCEKLEAYSREAITNGFTQQLKDSTIVWQVENFEKEGNEHFAKDYQLFSQSLILSRLRDGKEKEWKNLDKIWQLVGNKEEFITYVQTEVEKFMNPAEKE